MPVLLKMMNEESLMKMKTHTVSAIINFAKGLLVDDEEGEEGSTDKIMESYSSVLFENLIALLKKAIDENYEPL